MPKIKRTYAAPAPSRGLKPDAVTEHRQAAGAAPHRRIDDYDVDKLVFWVCVCLFAFAFAVVK
jgi:hypothetical protein